MGKIKWAGENVGIPILLIIIGFVVKDYYDEYRKPRLETKEINFISAKIDGKYKIETRFSIFNYGKSKAEKHKIIIEAAEKIHSIYIDKKYLSKMEIFAGGEGFAYVGYLITLEKQEEVSGKIIFFNNIGWPEEGIKPIKISY